MDTAALAVGLTTFLAPLVPCLVKAGEAAATETGKKLFGGAEAIDDLAAAPEQGSARQALAWRLEKLLTASPSLAVELAALFEQAEAVRGTSGESVTASGPRSVAIGGSTVSGKIGTGNRAQGKIRTSEQ